MVAKKMERVLLIMWFVSLVFVCIIGYREIINAVPYKKIKKSTDSVV